jgi:hypothetical protein
MHPIIKTDFAFLECRSGLPGSAFILHLQPPFYIGNVATFRTDGAYLERLGRLTFIKAVVPGCRIIINIAGSLNEGKVLTVDPDTITELQELAFRMADFFRREKIAFHKNYYSQFKL